jgi:hypothetical protein
VAGLRILPVEGRGATVSAEGLIGEAGVNVMLGISFLGDGHEEARDVADEREEEDPVEKSDSTSDSEPEEVEEAREDGRETGSSSEETQVIRSV